MGHKREITYAVRIGFVALALLLGLTGCGLPRDTLNIGNGAASRGPSITLIAPTSNLFCLQTSTWTATWAGGSGPFTISWDFGGGAANIPAMPATSPAAADCTWFDSASTKTYTVTVTVSDAQGISGSTSATVSIGPTQNAQPYMDCVAGDDGTLTVYVWENDGDPVTVTVSGFYFLQVDSHTKLAESGGSVVFYFTFDDPYGGSEYVEVTVDDGNGGTDFFHIKVTVPPLDGWTLNADYDRFYQIVTLQMDFREYELVSIRLHGPDWVRLSGTEWYWRTEVRGGWTEFQLPLELLESDADETLISFEVSSIPVDFDPEYYRKQKRDTAEVLVKRPLFISDIGFDYEKQQLQVEVDSVKGYGYQLDLTVPDGVSLSSPYMTDSSSGKYFSDVTYPAGSQNYGFVDVSIKDSFDHSDSDRILVLNEHAGIIPDFIFAWFDRAEAAVEEPVVVTVATGELESSFQYMTGVGLVINDDAAYVRNSFNVGSPGGARDDADGIWESITADGGFLLAPDLLIQPGPDPDRTLPEGFIRFDFNITPFYGHDEVGVSGDLFNCQFTFSEPGEKNLSFQAVNGVNRTYYTDFETGYDRFWQVCSNFHPGLQTTLTVN